MGKNSNAHKSRATLSVDLEREREDEAKRAAARTKKMSRAGFPLEMEVEGTDAAPSRMKKFGKVHVGKRKKLSSTALPIGKSLGAKKVSKGIRKPSSVMRKTLKKMAKRREMVSFLRKWHNFALLLLTGPVCTCYVSWYRT